MRCTIVFVVLVGLFYAFVHSPSVHTSFWHSYLVLHAQIADRILTFFGYETHLSGTTVVGTRFAMEIVRGCDAIEPIAIYTAAVIASPMRVTARVIGVVAGSVAIAVINIFRLIMLFLVGTYWQSLFDILHEGVWQVVLIAVAIVFWTIWVNWASPKTPESIDVTS